MIRDQAMGVAHARSNIEQGSHVTIRTFEHGGLSLRRGMSRRAALGSLIAAAGLAGCAGVNGLRTIETLTPAGDYTLDRDAAYGPSARQRVDVYRPRLSSTALPPPTVVFFYGGSWRRGDKESYRFVGEYLSRLGVIAVVADYRLHPEVTFPAFVEDGAAAVAWASREAMALGGDPSRVFAMGHSAGAHIAVLLALEPRYLALRGMASERLAGVIGI
ncbi:MAG: alpha/beta hydrolase, partial [Alphaproteobacteria bacterium]|nr:alpha/beta hydrolase [Alphaproteobacteria bacterium]